MKKVAFICLLLLSLRAPADVTVVEHVQSDSDNAANNKSQDFTFKIKGDKIRVDSAQGKSSVIFDTGTGDTITLMHKMKVFIKAPGDMLKGLIAQTKMVGGAGREALKIVDTGRREKVGDYDAEVYTIDSPLAKTTLWVSNKVPAHAVIQEAMTGFLGQLEKLGVPNLPDISKMDGAVVKTETVNVHGKVTGTLVSVNENPVADADMQPPSDYSEMTINDLQSGKFMQLMQQSGMVSSSSATATALPASASPAPSQAPDSGNGSSAPAPSAPQLDLRQ